MAELILGSISGDGGGSASAGRAFARPRAGVGVGAGLPARVASHMSGGRDLWSKPLPRRPEDPERAARRALGEVLDPELPVSVIDLGLVYGVRVDGDRARIRLTFTATACPCMDFIEEDVRNRLLAEPWISAVEIERVWDPPWTSARITPAGRRALRDAGVSA